MRVNSLKLYSLVFTILFSFNTKAQRFDTVIKKLNVEYRQEKLYLQFDRTLYNPGETIWFKAYLFAGNFPSLISKTLYTELTDGKGVVLQRVTSPVVMSGAAGSLQIPDAINGPVHVRAYTQWMLNFDSSFLFTKAIAIIPPKKTIANSPAASTAKINPLPSLAPIVVQFFPEGGDLVEGLESRVAFKATNPFGTPVSLAGEILDGKGKKITSFVSVHDGMGTFILQPKAGEHYKAVWKNDQGQFYESVLPIPKLSGIVLEADNSGNQIDFEIKHASGLPPYPFVYVVAQMQQQLVYKAKVYLDKTSSIGLIPIANFPAGIVQITVFTPDEQPVAERIIFANLSDFSFTTTLNALTLDSGKRKKNVIQIDVPDTLVYNLSVAVTDADLNPPASQDNIYSSLLLTSDIKGYVYNPAYYFSGDADSIANHLDLVMMTNGWRRFKWENVLAGYFPKLNYLPENYLAIEGKIHGMSKKLFAGKEINGVIELKGRRKEFLNIPVQPDGKFSYGGMIFYDTAKFFYQFNNDKKKTLTSRADFDIQSNLLTNALRLPPDKSSLIYLNYLDSSSLKRNSDLYEQQLSERERKKYTTLKDVVITKKIMSRKDSLDKEYTSGFFSDNEGVQSRTILPDEDPSFRSALNLFAYLQSRIAGLQINVNITDATIYWRGFETALFVDEIAQIKVNTQDRVVQDPSYILALPMGEIAMVKIFDPPFSGATAGGPGGAIAVYLKKATIGNQMTKGLDYINVAGYSPVKEFYSPDYSMPPQNDSPDYRSTLYWNPFIIAGKDHRHISITFYNNDFTKNMKVIIEGCDENGKLTRVEKILQ